MTIQKHLTFSSDIIYNTFYISYLRYIYTNVLQIKKKTVDFLIMYISMEVGTRDAIQIEMFDTQKEIN